MNSLKFGLLLAALSTLLVVGCSGGKSPTPAPTMTPPTATERPFVQPTATAKPAPTSAQFRLTILHNNDGESQLVSLDPPLEDYGGVARFVAVVRGEKAEAVSAATDSMGAGVITVSSGDNFVPSPELAAGMRAGVFYDAVALDLIGYDAIALGNHDFDLGPDVLAGFIKQVSASQATFVSANLDFSGEPALRSLFEQGRIAESRVVQTGGTRVGIIGATTPDLGTISSPRHVEVLADVAGEVQAEVARLEASGVNKIVLVSHLQDIDQDLSLVRQLSGVDVVVAGGGAEVLAGSCDLLIPSDEAAGPYPLMQTDRQGLAVPVVTTAGTYSYLGKLAVVFDASGHIVEVDEDASGPIRIAQSDTARSVRPNCEAQRTVVDPLLQALEQLKQPIADSQVAFDGRRSEVRSHETNQGDLMADALLWQARKLAASFGAPAPEIAFQNGGGIRNNSVLPAGTVRELDTFDMAPFANFVTVVEGITREQVKVLLENAVSKVEEGDGRFAQVAGLSFEWSASGTAQQLNPDGSVRVPGTRVQKVVLDSGPVIVGGGKVIPGEPVTAATLDFLARGGDQYAFNHAPYTVLGVSYQQALANFVRAPDGLAGTITSADYPEGGVGRITNLP